MAFLTCVPVLLSGQDAALERSVRNIYGQLLIARAAQQRYTTRDPATAAANDSAIAGWLRAAGVPALDSVGRAQYPQAVAGAEADVRRLQGMVSLTLRMAVPRYATLGAFLEGTMPWAKHEKDLVRLRPTMGAALVSAAPPAVTPSAPGPIPLPSAAPSSTAAAAPHSSVQGATEVEGVYLRRVTTTGYGGMIAFAYRPFLHYADGSVFIDPSLAAAGFDLAASRATASHDWGRVVTRAGTTWQVRMLSTQRARDGLEREFVGVYRLTPARAGQSLSGEYRSLGGTGNLAVGGDAAVVVEDLWTFLPDGRFTRGGFAGSSNSGVTTSSTRATRAGRYRADGYAIELTYDNGSVERLLFGLDDTGGLVTVGGAVYTRKRG